jgi:hypothetical protein
MVGGSDGCRADPHVQLVWHLNEARVLGESEGTDAGSGKPFGRVAIATQIGENRARKLLKANEPVLCMG